MAEAAAPAPTDAPVSTATTTTAAAETAPVEAPAPGPVETPNMVVSGGIRYRADDAARLGIKADTKTDAEAIADNRKPVGRRDRGNTSSSVISKSTANTK